MAYWVIRALVRVIFRLVGMWRIEGSDNIPERGAVILAPNHISYLDPPLIGCAVNRPIWIMAKSELFQIPVLKWLMRALHAFPVQRGAADRAALRRVFELLAAGEVVVMFPEGTRSQTGELGEPEIGIGMIAARSGAPIVPIAIAGTDAMLPRHAKFLKRALVRIRFGAPIPTECGDGKPNRDAYLAIANRVMAGIRALREGL